MSSSMKTLLRSTSPPRPSGRGPRTRRSPDAETGANGNANYKRYRDVEYVTIRDETQRTVHWLRRTRTHGQPECPLSRGVAHRGKTSKTCTSRPPRARARTRTTRADTDHHPGRSAQYICAYSCAWTVMHWPQSIMMIHTRHSCVVDPNSSRYFHPGWTPLLRQPMLWSLRAGERHRELID